tara:strand:+ start:70 stop:813 length:744 start_codon:yes stop_codon:yes gene_type:complete
MLVDNSKNWSIKKSKVPAAGKGLYSRIKIPKNKILGEYYGKLYTPEEYSRNYVDPMYVWRANDGNYVDAKPIVRGNPLRYVNAPQNINQASWINTKVVMKYGKVYYKTTKKINPGEELWVDYGSGYFSGTRKGKPNYLKDPNTGYRCDHQREITKFLSYDVPMTERSFERTVRINDIPDGSGAVQMIYWTMDNQGDLIDRGVVLDYNPQIGTTVVVNMPPESENIVYFRFFSYKGGMSFCEKTNFVL